MTGFTPLNSKNRNINKRTLFTSIIVSVVIIGSFSLREFFPEHQIIKKLFGGINIIIFWAIFFTIYHNIEKWMYKKNNKKSVEAKADKVQISVSIRLIAFSLFVIVLFFISLRYFDGLGFLIFWIVFIGAVWAINLYLERKGN